MDFQQYSQFRERITGAALETQEGIAEELFRNYSQYFKRVVGEAAQPFEGTAEELFKELLFGAGKTVIVSMPSLSGKTTIMQLAGFLKPHSKVLVFCPTNALINQQLEQLESLRAHSGTFEAVSVASENLGSGRELSELLERIPDDEKIRFVYSTPNRIKLSSNPNERTLTSEVIREHLEKWIRTNVFTDIFCDDAYIDATEEPNAFRRNVDEFRGLRQGSPSTRWIIMSTMSQTKIDQITEDMSVNKADQTNTKIIRSASYFRKGIFYEVVDGSLEISGLKDKAKPGLIFTWYQDDAEFYAEKLGEELAKHYHADSSNRMNVVHEWRQGRFPIMAATFDSFRWGIVKIPLNFIHHSMYPKSLQFYYTESGRACGAPGQTVVARIYREQITRTNYRYHLNNLNPDVVEFINTPECRHKFLLERCFGEIIDPCGTSCDNCRHNKVDAKTAAQV